MAKIQFSAVVGDARGKTGGVVFTKNRSASVVRRKVSPIQPRTSYQNSVRANFTGNSKAWATTLTPAQRLAWNALAAQLVKKNIFGAGVHLSGFQLYQRVSRELSTIGVAPISDPPISFPASFPGGLTFAAAAGAGTMTLATANAPGATEVPVIYATPPLSAGKTFIGKKYNYIFQAAAATAGPYNIAAAYKAKYGNFVAGQLIAVAIKFIDNVSGGRRNIFG
jgi:hypothetical protein